MTSRDTQAAQTPGPDAPQPAGRTVGPTATLDYSNLPSRPPHAHAVKNAWLLALVFWSGAISSSFLILSIHAVVNAPTVANLGLNRFLVVGGHSTLIASFSSAMFALAITGKVFRSRRVLMRRPMAVTFVIGASVPSSMAICLLTAIALDFPPLTIMMLLTLFGLATIYPMVMAHWLGHRVE